MDVLLQQITALEQRLDILECKLTSSDPDLLKMQRNQVSNLFHRVAAIEADVFEIEVDNDSHASEIQRSEEVLRVIKACKKLQLSYVIIRTPSDYYSKTLEQRKHILKAKQVNQLCKTIILENTASAYSALKVENPIVQALDRFKYIAVVIQYVERLDLQRVRNYVYSNLNGEFNSTKHLISKKMISFSLCPRGQELSGFKHNAVCPIGMLHAMPIIVSRKIVQITSDDIYLGAGEIDLKFQVNAEQFVTSTGAAIASITID